MSIYTGLVMQQKFCIGNYNSWDITEMLYLAAPLTLSVVGSIVWCIVAKIKESVQQPQQ
jgi:hypothetical protein